MSTEPGAGHKDNRVSLITFNYDRSLEFYLCKTLAESFGKTEEEAGLIIKDMGPIHLHGRLGYLPWQVPGGRAYSPEVDRRSIENCARHVKVVNRNVTLDAAGFDQAKRLMAAAESVCFLGVGFNNDNMARLGVFDFPQGKACSSGVDLTGKERGDLTRRFGGHLGLHPALLTPA